jgi:hypothetical protein
MIEEGIDRFLGAYDELVGILPLHLKFLPTLFFIAIMIALYGIFIWFFYRFLAKRDVLKLDLAKYNVYKHPAAIKLLAIVFYILEFMIISPLAIFFWFATLSIFLIVLAKGVEVGTVILICAGLISAIRITSYFNEDLSKDLAKLIPLTLLGVVILTPGFLDISTSLNRILEIPLFFKDALYYLLFIIGLEIILRLFYLPFVVIESEKE